MREWRPACSSINPTIVSLIGRGGLAPRQLTTVGFDLGEVAWEKASKQEKSAAGK